MFFKKSEKIDKKYLSIKYYYETLCDFKITRDPITGLFGVDINEEFGMILWVLPGSPAEEIGILPRDLIYAIDGIRVNPGDTWYQKYLLYRHQAVFTLIPTNQYFDEPKLIKKWIRINTRMGDIITRDLQHALTLSFKTKGKAFHSYYFNEEVNRKVNGGVNRGEIVMEDTVYI